MIKERTREKREFVEDKGTVAAESGGAESSSCVQGATQVSTFLMGSEEARWEQGLELVLGVGTQLSI